MGKEDLRKVCRNLYILSVLDVMGICVLLVDELSPKDTIGQR